LGAVALFRLKLNPGKKQRDPGYLKKTFGGWALVTGASSGIGTDMAEILASEGYDLIITARREDRLKEISSRLTSKYAGLKVRIVISDLSKRDGASNLFKEVEDLDVGLLINNAGAGWFGWLHNEDPEHIESIIQLNCTSMAILTRLFIEKMRKRPSESGIIITSSLGAYMGIPLTAVYTGAKAMASHFGAAVIFEQRASGGKVRISVLEPGATATEFSEVSTQGKKSSKERTDMSSSKDCAETSLNYLAANVPFCIPADKDYFMSVIIPLLPRLIAGKFGYDKYKAFVGDP